MIKVAICEDEKFYLKYISAKIERLLVQFGENYSLERFLDGTAFHKKMKHHEIYDIVFLDIDMPGIDGLSLGKTLRQIAPDSYLIYISGREDLVFDSFQTKPYAFIPKSRLDKMLPAAMSSLYRSMHTPGNYLTFSSNGVRYQWNILKLIYIECIDRILYIHFSDKTEELYYTLNAMEELLTPYGFLRIHKGFLVNYRYIFRIKKNEVLLDTMQILPLSKRRAADIQSRFHSLCETIGF